MYLETALQTLRKNWRFTTFEIWEESFASFASTNNARWHAYKIALKAKVGGTFFWDEKSREWSNHSWFGSVVPPQTAIAKRRQNFLRKNVVAKIHSTFKFSTSNAIRKPEFFSKIGSITKCRSTINCTFWVTIITDEYGSTTDQRTFAIWK